MNRTRAGLATAPVQTLLGAVRRRLWRWQFVAALRQASWSAAGLMLLAVAVHLAARPVAVGAVLWALAVLWAAMLARAGWGRPSDSACATWADRHLDGASAYSTLLDTGKASPTMANAQAVRWLESWAGAKAQGSLRLLAERQAPTRLLRPLLAMGVCAALAGLVLTLPELARVSPPPGAAPTHAADRPLPVAAAPASAELAREIAGALRSSPPRDAARGREGGAAAVARGQADEGQAPPATAAVATPAGAQAPPGAAAPGTAHAAGPAAATATGSGAGREAGQGRDNNTGAGVSRRAQATIAVPRSAARALRPSGARQADMEQVAVYDDTLSMPGAAQVPAGPAPAAAAPPAATGSVLLSTTETSYVQAWLKASPRKR